MTDQLRTALRSAADDHPAFTLDGDPWSSGRRIRLRRRLTGVGGAAITAAAVVVATVVLTTPNLASAPEPAQERPAEPTLPDTLYEVPLNVPDISDDPLGEPAAVVYRGVVRTGVFSEATMPLVVGAETGELRAVREVPCCRQGELSPDGTMLAVGTGGEFPFGPDSVPDPPTVQVVNLLIGEAAKHVLPDMGLGGGVEALAWAPDSAWLAVTAMEWTEISQDGDGGTAREVYGYLDIGTGEWREHDAGTVLAIPRDGRAPTFEGPERDYVIAQLNGVVGVVGSFGRAIAFSPDGRQLAELVHPASGFTESDRYLLELVDARTGEVSSEIELGDYAFADLVGWGERGVLVTTGRQQASIDGNPPYRVMVERIDVTDAADPRRSMVLVDRSNSGYIGIADAFVDADIRQAQPPQAGFDWIRWLPDPFILAVLGVIATPFVLRAILNRRNRVMVVPASAKADPPRDDPAP